MRPSRAVLTLAALAVPLLSACDQPESPTSLPATEAVADLDGAGHGVFGEVSSKRTHAHGFCASARYRDFDFWVGGWNVFNAAGAVTATSRITSELDGCAVLEEWMPGNGARGRSINAYDRTDGKWHQMWVAPGPFSPLRIAGVKKDGVLEMSGVRTSPFGFSVVDTMRWRAISADVVNQSGSKHITGGFVSTFSIDYHRTDDLQPVPEAPATPCQPGGPAAENRLADFLVGAWRITTEHGLPLGTSSVESALSGCLFVERIAGPLGFASITYFHYDAVTNVWNRGSIDNLGNWLEMTGPVDLAGGPIVLTGVKGGPAGTSVLVRLTIESVGVDALRQTLQTSRDGGASWSRGVTLAYRK